MLQLVLRATCLPTDTFFFLFPNFTLYVGEFKMYQGNNPCTLNSLLWILYINFETKSKDILYMVKCLKIVIDDIIASLGNRAERFAHAIKISGNHLRSP